MHSIISDYKTELADKIDSLFDNIIGIDDEYLSVEKRNSQVDSLVEDYFNTAGEVPPSHLLDRMSSYILKEDNRSRKGKKMAPKHEHPYLSEQQYERRITKEASLTAAETYDTEGVNQQLPTRQNRIDSELKRNIVK